MIIKGKIKEIGSGYVKISVPDSFIKTVKKESIRELELVPVAEERITLEQIQYIHVLIDEICDHYGVQDPGEMLEIKQSFKNSFVPVGKLKENLDMQGFSTADLNIKEAIQFIDSLVTYCVDNKIQTRRPLKRYCGTLEAWSYLSIKKRICAVCRLPGSSVHLHYSDVGAKGICLCNKHCVDYAQAREAFLKENHLEMVDMNRRTSNKLGIEIQNRKSVQK